MNDIEHLSFWAKCSRCGHWAWDIYMAFATLRPKAYVCLFCALPRKLELEVERKESSNAQEPEAVGGTPCAPEDFFCNCD